MVRGNDTAAALRQAVQVMHVQLNVELACEIVKRIAPIQRHELVSHFARPCIAEHLVEHPPR